MLDQVESGALEGGKSRRVYLLLHSEIAGGALQPGAALPGEHKLAERYGVSRVTIRRALDALAQDGLIEKRAGSGSIVRSPTRNTQTIAADIANLMPQLARMAAKTEARLLAFSYQPAGAQIAAALGLDAGATVQRAVRVRLIDGRPFSYLTTHVPEAVARSYSEADLATKPLYALLELSGVRIESAQQSVSAALASPEVAQALDMATGSALLSLERVVRDETGRCIEHLSAHYRPDRFHLSMSLERAGDSDNRYWEPIAADSLIAHARAQAAE